MGEYYTREIKRLKRERKDIDRAISDFERLGEKGVKTPDRNAPSPSSRARLVNCPQQPLGRKWPPRNSVAPARCMRFPVQRPEPHLPSIYRHPRFIAILWLHVPEMRFYIPEDQEASWVRANPDLFDWQEKILVQRLLARVSGSRPAPLRSGHGDKLCGVPDYKRIAARLTA
jgi:hypothetical protein